MFSQIRPTLDDVRSILAPCWGMLGHAPMLVGPMFDQGGTYVQQLAKFWLMFTNV